MLIRDIMKPTAQRMNKQTVNLVETLEENFTDVIVVVDSLSEQDSDGKQITVTDPDTGELVYNTDNDFMIVQSGNIFPTQQSGKCFFQERTTIMFASINRPDILEDILVFTAIANNSNVWKLESIDKDIQPLGQTGNDLTIVEVAYTRMIKV